MLQKLTPSAEYEDLHDGEKTAELEELLFPVKDLQSPVEKALQKPTVDDVRPGQELGDCDAGSFTRFPCVLQVSLAMFQDVADQVSVRVYCVKVEGHEDDQTEPDQQNVLSLPVGRPD